MYRNGLETGDLGREARRWALENVEYAPETGALTWKVSRAKGKWIPEQTAGQPAGMLYRYRGGTRRFIRVLRRRVRTSRLIWLMVKGHWPQGVVDHIDGDTMNERWENLRDITWEENSENWGTVQYDEDRRAWDALAGGDRSGWISLGLFEGPHTPEGREAASRTLKAYRERVHGAGWTRFDAKRAAAEECRRHNAAVQRYPG